MTTYIRFTENNDWEGETWHFYIPLDNPKLDLLKAKLSSNDEMFGCYTLGEREYDEATVDTLVANSDGGYMNTHNKVEDININEDEEDPFFKGSAFVLADA